MFALRLGLVRACRTAKSSSVSPEYGWGNCCLNHGSTNSAASRNRDFDELFITMRWTSSLANCSSTQSAASRNLEPRLDGWSRADIPRKTQSSDDSSCCLAKCKRELVSSPRLRALTDSRQVIHFRVRVLFACFAAGLAMWVWHT